MKINILFLVETGRELMNDISVHCRSPSFIFAVVLKCLWQLQPVNGHPVDNVLLDGLPTQCLQRGD